MKKRFAAIVLAILLIGVWTIQSFAGTSLTDAKKQQKELNAQLGDISKEKEQVKKELITNKQIRAEIVQNLEKKGYEKEKIEERILQIESAINTLNDAIAIAEKELSDALDLYRERMVMLYINSKTMKELDELLSSKNMSELYQKMQSMKMVSTVDQALITDIEEKQAELEELILRKEKEEQTCEAEVEVYLNQMKELEVSRAQADQQISETKQSLEEVEKEEKAIQAESKQLEALIVKLSQANSIYVGGSMQWPVPSRSKIGSPFGMRLHPVYRKMKMHNGIDIGGDYNLDVVAANDGTVVMTTSSKTSGNMIVVDHGGGISTLYLHLNKRGILVKEGQKVTAGQVIGKMGSTGLSTGPHLHFEYRVNGVPKNPVPQFGKLVEK